LKFKFDLNSNWFAIYKTVLKKGFSNFLRLLGRIPGSAQPASSRAHGLRGPAGWLCGPRMRTRIAKPNPTR
jgi:hypothetical protein